MRAKIFAGFLGVLVIAVAGCVSTVGGGRTAGVPFLKDSVQGRYQRSVDEVYNAAKDVISANGVLERESVLHGETNVVKTAIGVVSQRTVYVRVEPVDSKITQVTVQTRNRDGGSDIDLAHELEKEIALRLVQQPPS